MFDLSQQIATMFIFHFCKIKHILSTVNQIAKINDFNNWWKPNQRVVLGFLIKFLVFMMLSLFPEYAMFLQRIEYLKSETYIFQPLKKCTILNNTYMYVLTLQGVQHIHLLQLACSPTLITPYNNTVCST